jgi:4-amino-4-deoxy-L-arabinose transferase-like glycosyltransferase
VAALLLSFGVQAVIQSAIISPVYEEPITVASGFYQLKTGDFSLNPTHPSLNFYLAAIPLLFITPQPEFPFSNADCMAKNMWECTEAFINSNTAIFQQDLLWIRLPHVIIGMLACLLIYAWAKRLFGRAPAVIALALAAFNPALIAYSGIVAQNILITFFVMLDMFLFWLFLRKPSPIKLAMVAFVFGLALSTEYTAVLLLAVIIPYFAAAIFLKQITVYEQMFHGTGLSLLSRLKYGIFAAVLFAVCAFFPIWLAYQGQLGTLASSVPPHYVEYVQEHVYPRFNGIPVFGKALPFIVEKLPIPFPTLISVFGLQFLYTTGNYKLNFLAGHIYGGMNLAYFFVLIFFKTPIPLLILFAAGLFRLWQGRKALFASGNWLLLALPLVFLLFFMFSSRNAGLNHILPGYAFMIVIAAGSVFRLKPKHAVVLVLLVAWAIAEAVIASPDYISYYNEFLPKDEAYKMFSDNGNDAGQALNELAGYMEKNSISQVNLSYLGGINPSVFGINYTYLASPRFQPWIPGYDYGKPVAENCGPVKGVIAISVINLNGVYMANQSCYGWLKQLEPEANLGGSILVYRIS